MRRHGSKAERRRKLVSYVIEKTGFFLRRGVTGQMVADETARIKTVIGLYGLQVRSYLRS